MPEDATRVHGITSARLIGKPIFGEIAGELLEFFGDEEMLIAHNAGFDCDFLNAELLAAGLPPLLPSRMVDTVELARAKFPGMPASLDALCPPFEIDLSARTTHKALLDCELLAKVYVELIGGRQRGLELTFAKRAVEPFPHRTGGDLARVMVVVSQV